MRNNPDIPGLGPGLVAELVCESALEKDLQAQSRNRPAQVLKLRGKKLERKRKSRRLGERPLLQGSQ